MSGITENSAGVAAIRPFTIPITPEGGYRFKGPAVICEPGSAVFAEGIERLRAAGSTLTGRAGAIVVIEVRHAAPLVSPAYDDGTATEADIFQAHRARFARLHEHRASR